MLDQLDDQMSKDTEIVPKYGKNRFSFGSLYPHFLIFIVFLFGFMFFSNQPEIKKLPYSEFLSKLESRSVDKLVINGDQVTGQLKLAKNKKTAEEYKFFSTIKVDPLLAKEFKKFDVDFEATPASSWQNVFLLILGFIIIFSVISFFVRRNFVDRDNLGAMNIGKSKARIYVQKNTRTTFSDVAGVDEAIDELREVISFIHEPERYKWLGAKLPRGILLVGPPGTGKTLLAKALAGEAEVPFLSISGSEFVEMFVGVGASRVRDLFEQAQKFAPCIVFIDELDALGRSRGINPISGSNDEKEQTLNQLLSELDGFDSMDGVILLAATNRPEILDKALLRAGRFDRQIAVDCPPRNGRKAILEVHTRTVRISDDLDIDAIAKITPGFSGADLANLINEATLLAARDRKEEVNFSYFMEAFERIVGGLEKKSRAMSELERNIVSHHEIGHALVSLVLPGSSTLQKVSIIPRGVGTLGYTINQPNEDRFLMSFTELKDRLVVLLGGRAAEEVIFDQVSTGASDDFEKATEIARDMVTRFGMSESLGLVAYAPPKMLFLNQSSVNESLTGRRYSELTAREIDCEVREIIQHAYTRAKNIVFENQSKLREAATVLQEKESLDRDELLQLLSPLEVPKSDNLLRIPGNGKLSELVRKV